MADFLSDRDIDWPLLRHLGARVGRLILVVILLWFVTLVLIRDPRARIYPAPDNHWAVVQSFHSVSSERIRSV